VIDSIVAEHKKQLMRSIAIAFSWTIFGSIGLNSISSNRVLECKRISLSTECTLITKQLIGGEIPLLEKGEKLQTAKIERGKTFSPRSNYTCEVYVVTNRNRYRFTSCDNGRYDSDNPTIREISSFFANNQDKSLRLESDRHVLFWILSGIFIGFSLLIIWAIRFQSQIIIDSTKQK
jgi:hypothetical protein